MNNNLRRKSKVRFKSLVTQEKTKLPRIKLRNPQQKRINKNKLQEILLLKPRHKAAIWQLNLHQNPIQNSSPTQPAPLNMKPIKVMKLKNLMFTKVMLQQVNLSQNIFQQKWSQFTTNKKIWVFLNWKKCPSHHLLYHQRLRSCIHPPGTNNPWIIL